MCVRARARVLVAWDSAAACAHPHLVLGPPCGRHCARVRHKVGVLAHAGQHAAEHLRGRGGGEGGGGEGKQALKCREHTQRARC